MPATPSIAPSAAPPSSPEEFRRQDPGRFFLDGGDPAGLTEYLRRLGVLKPGEVIVEARPAGAGNMNCTVRARTPHRSVIVKQSRPWVEKYPQFAAPWDRALRERDFYQLIGPLPLVAARMPRLLGSDPAARVLVLEDLGTAGDYSDLYRGGSFTGLEVEVLAGYLAALHGAFLGQADRPRLVNREMRELNHAHVFVIPLAPDNGLDLDRIEPGLAAAARLLTQDRAYVAEVARLGQELYLADGPCLLHGDFFPGSFVRTEGGPRVLDPEFGFFGRPEWDAGVFLAHLWMAGQPEAIRERFLACYRPPDGFEEGVMKQLAGVEIMRRLIGYAQLPLDAAAPGTSRPGRVALLELSRELVLGSRSNPSLRPGGSEPHGEPLRLLPSPTASFRLRPPPAHSSDPNLPAPSHPAMNRRSFLHLAVTAACAAPTICVQADLARSAADVAERVRGLMYGTALGDALGGPIEFQPPDAVHGLPDAPKAWREGEQLDAAARQACAGRLRLRSYQPLRPKPESYAMWNHDARAGTITDDTRHKIVLLEALHRAERKHRWPLQVTDLARAYLDFGTLPAIREHAEYAALCADWLEEWQYAARWVLGDRETARARPPERMWQSLPTCSGQMTLLPVAALYPGDPERAYRAAWHLAFFDNGFGRDLNAALVAGLAQALVTPIDPANPGAAWKTILATLRETDPWAFGKIRWTQRSVARWLDFARASVKSAEGQPARLFAAFEKEFAQNHKWEAQVPVVVAFGCLELAGWDPLAALQLCLEWGHDTDSFAQVLGAFVGALHGPGLFRPDWLAAVKDRMQADLHIDWDEECRMLTRLEVAGRKRLLVRQQ